MSNYPTSTINTTFSSYSLPAPREGIASQIVARKQPIKNYVELNPNQIIPELIGQPTAPTIILPPQPRAPLEYIPPEPQPLQPVTDHKKSGESWIFILVIGIFLSLCALVVIIVIVSRKPADNFNPTPLPAPTPPKQVKVKNLTGEKINIATSSGKIFVGPNDTVPIILNHYDFIQTPYGTLKHNASFGDTIYFLTNYGPRSQYEITSISVTNSGFITLLVKVESKTYILQPNSTIEINDVFQRTELQFFYSETGELIKSIMAGTTKKIIYNGEFIKY